MAMTFFRRMTVTAGVRHTMPLIIRTELALVIRCGGMVVLYIIILFASKFPLKPRPYPHKPYPQKLPERNQEFRYKRKKANLG
jgi:hypothetical protein